MNVVRHSLAALLRLDVFEEVWAIDFEYRARPGERVEPVCLVALELRSGRLHRVWEDELRALDRAPFRTDPKACTVCYYASAEASCFLELDWELPASVVDLFAEFRVMTNGVVPPGRWGLLSALHHFDLPSIDADEKKGMIDLILAGGPYSDEDKAAILHYCESDVRALQRLLPAMEPYLANTKPRLREAWTRGRYGCAVAAMEQRGVPIDTDLLARLKRHWSAILERLVEEVDRNYGIYDGTTFKMERFGAYLQGKGISWPTTKTGRLATDDATFRTMATIHPEVSPLYELRSIMGRMRQIKLAVGADGRCRAGLSMYRSKTGRNQPGSTAFIFGPSRWVRGLIKPAPGMAVAYLDWSSQEVGIAAALSEDPNLLDAYRSGDVYLAFGKQAGIIPPGGAKETHPRERSACKRTVLGVQYGMSPKGIAEYAGVSLLEGRNLLQAHRQVFRRFWAWVENIVDQADFLTTTLRAPLGWEFRLGQNAEKNPRSLQNWMMQATGSEMMRLASIYAHEQGIGVCCPVHDAFLIEAKSDDIEETARRMAECMEKASNVVLDGRLTIGVGTEIVTWPDRFMDENGLEMFQRVIALLETIEIAKLRHPGAAAPSAAQACVTLGEPTGPSSIYSS